MNRTAYTSLFALLMLLAGCSSTPDHSARYTIDQDRAPAGNFDVSGLADAVPRYEEPRRAGNKSPYEVWGQEYRVLGTNQGYVQRGIASWYGEKFHGHKTSNGEIFNMYAMSAAHKSLRLPGYARVTNLDNGQSVVVRVNDRGPFHDDRLIDLSYAAAKKLGYLGKGTARVEVAAITVDPDGQMWMAGKPYQSSNAPVARVPERPAAAPINKSLFVQLGSFSQRDPAELMLQKVRSAVNDPGRVREIQTEAGRFHRVQVGPFQDEVDAANAQERLRQVGFYDSIVLTDTH